MRTLSIRFARLAALPLAAWLGVAEAGPPAAADWEGCSAITGDAERLACYDRLAGRPRPAETVVDAHVAAPAALARMSPSLAELALGQEEPEPKLLSALSRHWELDDAAKQGAFLFRPHHPSYFLPFKHTNRPNNTPFHSVQTQPGLGLEDVEAKLQLSFKFKALEGILGNDDADLWFGFTTTSFWQAYNDTISAPFRETNYAPEAMLVLRTDYSLAGFRGRFVNFGLIHQSNGRSEPLSRSWNRVYAQFGLERGNLAVLVRPWYRIPDNEHKSDNPDIEDYLGHGDLQLVYRNGRQSYSLLLRNNFERKQNRGAFELSWGFPLYGRLNGYVQYFNGYGESLIDYDHRQQTIGIGIGLAEGL